VIPYGKRRPVALRWGSHEELYRPSAFYLLHQVIGIKSFQHNNNNNNNKDNDNDKLLADL